MRYAQSMLDTHPLRGEVNTEMIAGCIADCYACAQTCTSCADACLAEDNVFELVRCIRLNLDCADVCGAMGRLMSRLVEATASPIRSQLEACVVACGTCAEECERHAGMHEHCRVCAEACRACEESCRHMLASLGTEARA